MVLIVVLIWNVGTSMAQNGTETVTAADDKYKVEKIIFKNEEGEVVSTYDIAENNPFAAKAEAIQLLQSNGSLEGNKVKDFVMNSDQYLDPQGKDMIVDHVITNEIMVLDENKEIRGVAYMFMLFNEGNEARGFETVVNVFNESGGVKTSIDLHHGIQSIVMSKDSDFLGVIYGGGIDHNGYALFNPTFDLIDIISKEVVHSTISYSVPLSNVISHKGYIHFRTNTSNNSVFYFLKTEERVVYSKQFTRDELGKNRDIDSSGMTIFFEDSESYLDFNSEFIIEKF